MKSRNPILPFLMIAMVSLASHQSCLAFGGPPGGPFSNGSYFPNDGTFTAVVRGENLTGTVQFSTTSGPGPAASSSTSTSSLDFGLGLSSTQSQTSSGTGGVGSTGVSTIFYEGDTFQGNSQGTYNPSANRMTVSFQADAAGQGEKTIKVKEAVTSQQALPTYGPDGNITGYVTVNATSYQDTQEIYYFDSLFLSGIAECSTSNSFPNQKFQGSGDAEFQHLVFTGATPFLDAVPIPITVSGVRLSNTASAFHTSDVRPPSVNQFTVLIE